MSTKTTTKTEKNNVANAKKNSTAKKATPAEIPATAKEAKEKLDAILKPNGKTVVQRLKHAQILADKYENMSAKYDDLTHFIAGKDNDNSFMKFASENGYSFTLNNPAVIGKVLELVEGEFSNALESAENDLLNFQV